METDGKKNAFHAPIEYGRDWPAGATHDNRISLRAARPPADKIELAAGHMNPIGLQSGDLRAKQVF